MEPNTFLAMLVELIQNIGFPIAIVIYLLYDRSKREDKYDEQTMLWVQAINNNTDAIKELTAHNT